MKQTPARAEALPEEMASMLPRLFIAMKAVQTRVGRPIGPPVHESLTHRQMELLVILHHSGGRARVSDLARRLGISAATLSTNAKRLIAGGYLWKARDTEDERGVHLEIAPKARRVFETQRRKEVAFFRAAFTALPEAKVRQTIGALRFVIKAFLEAARR